MPTTREIARAAGVSQPTVSRALANDPSVAPATRKRVVDLAASMGYRPNPMVSALMAKRRNAKPTDERQILAYLTTDSRRDAWKSIHTYVNFYQGASERASMHGFDLEEFWLVEPKMTAQRMSQILHNRNIQGILIAPLRSDHVDGKHTGKGHVSLDWRWFSPATLGYTLMRPGIHRATHNHLQGIRLAIRQLQKLGYTRIGLSLHAAHDARVDYNWSTGYAKYLLSQNPSARLEPFIRESHQYVSAKFLSWFESERPDAIISGTSMIYAWLQDAGIRTPEDVGLAVLDRMAGESVPLVAGVDQNSKAVGAAAIDLVIAQIHRNERGLPALPKLTLIEGFWANGPTVRQLR